MRQSRETCIQSGVITFRYKKYRPAILVGLSGISPSLVTKIILQIEIPELVKLPGFESKIQPPPLFRFYLYFTSMGFYNIIA
jgi:hypothetical protein